MAIHEDRNTNSGIRKRFARLGGEQGDMWLFVVALAVALVVGFLMFSSLTRDSTPNGSEPTNTSSPISGTNTTSNPQRAPKQP